MTAWYGYRRPDGSVGSRNYVGIIPSVTCANDVASAICREVQGTVTYPHHQGCCQLPLDLKRVTDTLSNLGQSANVGAALIVSLGCEGTDHERIVEEILECCSAVAIIVACIVNRTLRRPAAIVFERVDHLSATLDFH